MVGRGQVRHYIWEKGLFSQLAHSVAVVAIRVYYGLSLPNDAYCKGFAGKIKFLF